VGQEDDCKVSAQIKGLGVWDLVFNGRWDKKTTAWLTRLGNRHCYSNTSLNSFQCARHALNPKMTMFYDRYNEKAKCVGRHYASYTSGGGHVDGNRSEPKILNPQPKECYQNPSPQHLAPVNTRHSRFGIFRHNISNPQLSTLHSTLEEDIADMAGLRLAHDAMLTR
jgi:hypothetical protein